MHRDIAGDIAARVKILPLFRRYLQEGYYPLYREVSSQFAQRLSAIVANVLEVDVPAVMDVTPSTVRKIKKMLMILAESCPQTPNMSTLYRELETDRNAGIRMFEVLESAELVSTLLGTLEKPKLKRMGVAEKVFLGDTNLMYALVPRPEIGAVRETFFANQCKSAGHEVVSPSQGDFVVDGKRVIVSRTGYTGEDGFEIYATPELTVTYWKKLLEAGVAPCGLGCRDTLRFEAGLPLYGDELTAEISPVMAGLGMFCKMDKPEFIGKEALADQKAGNIARKLVGIEIEDKAIPRAGYPVELEDGTEVGVVTTGYHSISLDKSICFALVDKAFSALDTPLWIHIRKKTFPGKVVKKRFYQTNYKK